jgi:hypothetical protein
MKLDQIIEVLNTRLSIAIEERNPTEIEFLADMLSLYYDQTAEIWKLNAKVDRLSQRLTEMVSVNE